MSFGLFFSSACVVCFGDGSSSQVKAAWAGISCLLIFIIFVLGVIGYTAVRWSAREKKLNAQV